MKFWHALAFLSPSEAIELASLSEDCGYDGVALPDHLFYPRELASTYPYSPDGRPGFGPETPWPDPWVLIGAMAARTSRIRFTTNVYVAPARDLFTVAKLVATAAVISGGRVVLGAGAGWMREEFEQTHQDFDSRGRRLEEMIPLLRRLWTGDWTEHHGRHFDFGAIKISPVPREPVPVWLGGHSPRALQRAARLGDGWIGVDYSSDEAERVARKLSTLLLRQGREPDHFEIVLALRDGITPEACCRLEDLGVTGLLCAPALFAKDPTPAGRRAATERFARRILDPCR